jgi:hypothetical protein
MQPDFGDIARLMIVLGVLLVVAGGAFLLLGRIPGLGRLPGDIVLQRDGFSCFIPIVTMILLSIVLTVLVNVIIRLINRP